MKFFEDIPAISNLKKAYHRLAVNYPPNKDGVLCSK